MSEQAIDVAAVLAVVRRHRTALVIAATCGFVAGAGLAFARPPMYSSTSMVLLPAPTQSSSGQAVSLDIATQVSIAGSDVVLGPASDQLKPHMSVQALSQRIEIDAPTDNIIRITASAATPKLAEASSQAMANSDVAYLKEAASSLSQAQLSALVGRQEALQKSLDSVNSEVRATQARIAHESSQSEQGKADATAMSELTAQQADLVLQVDEVKKQAAEGNQPANQSSGSASVIQAASPAIRPGLMSRYALFGFAGLAAALALVLLILLVLTRKDRRLRSRDEIADAVGTAVVASLKSRIARSAAGWSAILATYSPGTVDAWALRQAMRQLIPSEWANAQHRHVGYRDGKFQHPGSILMVVLSDDLRAVAIAPQLVSYAASVGVETRFVAAKGHESAAILWASCSAAADGGMLRQGLTVDTRPELEHSVELTVYLAVVDRREPSLVDLPSTSATVLVVSAGSATAEELARTAMVADDADIGIDGVIVADPDDLDHTTGRLLQQARVQQVSLPTRLTGATTGKASGNVSGLRGQS